MYCDWVVRAGLQQIPPPRLHFPSVASRPAWISLAGEQPILAAHVRPDRVHLPRIFGRWFTLRESCHYEGGFELEGIFSMLASLFIDLNPSSLLTL